MQSIRSIAHFEQAKKENPAVIFYFSHEQCSVCSVLKPKVKELIEKKFPRMALFFCDTAEQPGVAAQNHVFTVPTLLLFFEGKESYRFSRNIGLGELEQTLIRPYSLLF